MRRMHGMGRFALLSASLAGALGVEQMALAQDAATGVTQEIIVTGSRIRRSDTFDSPVPLATIDGDELRDSGFATLGDALSNLPQGMTTTSLQNASSTLFNTGQSRVDLRGLGSARTLVLVDGRRHLTGDFRTSAVDLNMIPATMIERVDAIAGGASAVYGSEAIAGVVNVILRKHYDGVLFDVQGGVSEEGDGEEWKAAIGFGMPFADGRGSFLIGGEYGKVEPIMQVDRSWAFPGVRRDTLAAPQTVVPASRSNTMPTATFQLIGGQNPATARSVSIGLDRDAVHVNTEECRTATVRPLCQDPWLFYGAVYNALQAEQERYSMRVYADYELTDKVSAFADVSFSHVDGYGIFQPAFSNAAGGGTLSVLLRGDNAFLNADTPLANQLRAHWVAAGKPLTRTSTAQVGKFWEEFGRRDSTIRRESYRAIAGLQGDFTLANREFGWDTYAQFSELEGYTIGHNVPQLARVQQATDAIMLNGQIACADAGARAAGCVPWDLINGPSADAVTWANADARADGRATQTVVAANLSTSLFDLPAGPVGVAVGIEYREETSDQIQDPLSASGALFYNAIGRTKGDYDITEGYAEVVVPLLKDLPFAHRLSVELAGRMGDYSTVGSVDQWRVQATWAPVQDVSFRASTAASVRAPNITELYAPQGQNFTTAATDPCDRGQIAAIAGDPARQATRIANCAAVIPGYSSDPANGFISNIGPGRPSLSLLQGGNPDVQEESADTVAVGAVIRPRWIENLSLSVDWWQVKIDEAIATIPINALITNLCYDASVDPASNRFCDLIVRDPTGASTGGLVGGISEVILTNQNVQSIETSGVDLAVQYLFDLGRAGQLRLRADGTKTIRWDLTGFPSSPVTHFGGVLSTTTIPTHKANGTLGWSLGDVNLQWQSRFTDSMAASEIDPPESRVPFFTGNYWEHDVRAGYRWNDSLSFRLGIINVTDERPPQLPESATGATNGSSNYDNRGRWFYLGVNYSFSPSR